MWANILETVSIVVAAIAVVVAMTDWRRSVLGQKRIDLAEQILVGFEEARNALAQIRSPIQMVGEGQTRKHRENETAQETELWDRAYVAIERYEKRSEIFSKLLSQRYLFEAYFGDEAAQPFSELDRIIWDVLMSSRRLQRLWLRQGTAMTKAQQEKHLADMHNAEAIFWQGSEDPDPIVPRIDKAVEEIKSTCGSVINPERNICVTVKKWCSGLTKFLRCH